MPHSARITGDSETRNFLTRFSIADDATGTPSSPTITMGRMHESTAKAAWKASVIIGATLLGVGLTGYSIDEWSSSELKWFIDEHLTVFGFAILFGSLGLMASQVGWANRLNKRGRVRIAKFALILPPCVLIVAGHFDKLGVHGVFMLYFLSIAPLMIVGLFVAVMAAKAHT